MSLQRDPLFEKAKNYSFRLLKFRSRSEKELFVRLKKKKFDDSVISKVLSILKEKRFIDDILFAKNWVESRLKRPLGFNRIKIELKSKGISEEVITKVLSEAKGQYDEDKLVYEIAKQRIMKLRNIDPFKAKRRLYSYLMRRGFSPDVVGDVMDRL